MKKKMNIGKRTVYAVLAATLLTVGIPENCMATVVTEGALSIAEQIEVEGGMLLQEGGEQAEVVSGAAMSYDESSVVSSGGISVRALGEKEITSKYKTTKTHLKLNFSYTVLGCVKVNKGSKLNVRERCSTEAKIVAKLKNGIFCNILEIYDNGWAKIKSGKVSGYVSTDYLTIGEQAEQMAVKRGKKAVKVTGAKVLNVRLLPTTQSKVHQQLSKGDTVKLKTEKVTKARVKKILRKNKSLRRQLSKKEKKKMFANLEDWVCVKCGGKKAFIAEEYVKVVYKVKTAPASAVVSEKVSGIRRRIVKYAKKFVGNRYVYGGSSLTRGTDCSGFTMLLYRHFGYRLGHSAASQSTRGKKISRSQLKPGDLLFYRRGGRISHVTMYIGDNKVIHASNEKNGIMISNVNYRRACSYRRILK